MGAFMVSYKPRRGFFEEMLLSDYMKIKNLPDPNNPKRIEKLKKYSLEFLVAEFFAYVHQKRPTTRQGKLNRFYRIWALMWYLQSKKISYPKALNIFNRLKAEVELEAKNKPEVAANVWVPKQGLTEVYSWAKCVQYYLKYKKAKGPQKNMYKKVFLKLFQEVSK
jgi:hypothetical protein